MSNESKEREDHTDELRKLFNEVQQGESILTEPTDELDGEKDEKFDQKRNIDILNLPPRKEVHSKNNKRTRLKIRRPFMRLLLVMVIIIVILFGLYYIWGEELLNLL